MRPLAFQAMRSPILWLVAVLAALLTAPAIASAQEIVVLTPSNNTASNMIVGDPSGRFHEYWFDYNTPGNYVEVEATPGNPDSWWTLMNRRRGNLGTSGAFGLDVWGPNGLIDDDDIDPRAGNLQLATRCIEGPGNRCWTWSLPAADVISPHTGRLLVKVWNYSLTGLPYTVEASNLARANVVKGVGPGMEASLVAARSRSATAGHLGPNERHYYSFLHEGGEGSGHDTDVTLQYTPGFNSQMMADNVGISIYRGTTLVQTRRGGSYLDGKDADTPGTARNLSTEYRTKDRVLLTVEIFNNNDNAAMDYAARIR